MSFRKTKKEILGINARNLLYISKYNSRAAKKFADDKIYTKNYLQSRDMPAARLYQVIRSYTELDNFNPESLPGSFVIKPNKGYGGEGIIVVVDKKNDKYISVDGTKYRWDGELYRHCESILSGRYSISGLHDQIIFEEYLIRHDYFDKFTSKGLPDVRIIVFNLIPVMAMLRLPTEESKGKANVHLGGIGLGIDMKSGKTTYGVTQKSVYKNEFIKILPNGDPTNSITIPYWDEILLMSAKAQAASKIGYLAADLAITKTGVKILELNARAGLALQIANLSPLRARLDKIVDLKVLTPEQGVEISKTLFTKTALPAKKDENKTESSKQIIGLYEKIEILNTKHKSILAKIDPWAKENIIDQDMDIEGQDKIATIKLLNKRVTFPFVKKKLGDVNYKVVIAGKYLTDFLIDASISKPQERKGKSNVEQDEKIAINVDKKICQIDEAVHLLSYLRPLNLDEEKTAFFEHANYNPKFIYRKVAIDVEQLKKDLKKIPTKFKHPLAPLFVNKIKEVDNKLSLIESVDTPKLQFFSEKLYSGVDKNLYDQAVEYIKQNPITKDESKILNFKTSIKKIEKSLKENKLHGWKIKIVEGVAVDMQVNKSGTIFVKKGAEFSVNRLESLIAHEIKTHIFRLENGRLQKYRIFERGTAEYLTTEEGLSIYNQNALGIHLGDKQIWPALNVIAVYMGSKMSFRELHNYLMENYFISAESAWKTCVKAKRGYTDTGEHLVFAKDHIYFKGLMMVEKFVKNYGKEKLKDLYIGKIGVNELKYVKNIKDYRVKYLP
ncbi:MAG: tyrosine/phenylalanine carboxypeptidase domain-containing protein [bacterium]